MGRKPIRMSLFVENIRNGTALAGTMLEIPLHHLNGPMVFCSQTSVALEFQR